jgi:probable rRNA maturation factor
MSRARGERATPDIEIVIESTQWGARRGLRTIVRRAIAQAAIAARSGGGEVAVLLTDDAAIRVLNRDWRGKNVPTNVLSFPAPQRSGGPVLPRRFGDIAIAYETTACEADSEGKPFADHLAHLVVHGFLHLVGFDHETDRDAEAMESLEVAVLARLGRPDPYQVRMTSAGAAKRHAR